MNLDFSLFFEKYKSLVTQVDLIFNKVFQSNPDCVKCKIGCSDCCYALFDLTLIEALYINHHFNELFKDKKRSEILDKADAVDREVHIIKRKAYKESQKGKDDLDIFMNIGKKKIKCPLLNDDDKCEMYEFRPITCRLYGIPSSFAEKSYTCGKSGFVQGENYPTVKMDKIYENLYNISFELVSSLETKYPKMADMMVPLSMAITTVYDDVYLGIKTSESKDNNNKAENK